ncbi:amidohydrolase [Thermaurantiacus sp.]
MSRLLAALFAPLLLIAFPAGARTLIVNANILSLDADGRVERYAMLLAGDDGRIEAMVPLGGREPPLKPGDYRLDARGATILPGFIDSHLHLMGLGLRLIALDLAPARSLDEALDRVRRHAARLPAGAWVTGGGWNQVRWGAGFPTAADLDRAVADRPAALQRTDGHALWVNSAVLKAAGITRATRDPPGGRILRDSAGNPTGILVDAAMDLVRPPPPGALERDKALATALAHLAELGVTSVHDMGVTPADWNLFRAFGDAGRLTVRITGYAAGMEAADDIAPLGPTPWLYDGRLRLQGVKLYADGALGSRGAWLKAPYADEPGNRGLRLLDHARLRNLMSRANFAGYQLAVHAIGDAANAEVLNAYAEIAPAYGSGLRNRIEHAQVLDPADIPRFRALGVTASMQPIHATSDRTMAEARLGLDRLAGAYAWRSLLASGALLAFGSDAPVEPANPFLGLHAATTRAGWRTEEALSLEAALAGFTVWAARAGLADGRAGRLVPGAFADFILLDEDPFQVPLDRLKDLNVRETWVAGVRVFQRGAGAATPWQP